MPKKKLIVKAWTSEPLVLADELFKDGVLVADKHLSAGNPIKSQLCAEKRRRACAKATDWHRELKGLCQSCVGSCMGSIHRREIAKDLRKQYKVKEQDWSESRVLNRYRHEMFEACHEVRVTIEEVEKCPSRRRSSGGSTRTRTGRRGK